MYYLVYTQRSSKYGGGSIKTLHKKFQSKTNVIAFLETLDKMKKFSYEVILLVEGNEVDIRKTYLITSRRCEFKFDDENFEL
jgi:hypothetical protein